MFIDFEKYAHTITNVSFDDEYNDEYQTITLETDGGISFKFTAVGDCCSTSIFRQFEDYKFTSLIGKTIELLTSIEVPDYYIDKYSETDEESDLYASYHMYQFNFVNSDEIFQFLLINFSNGYYDGWMDSQVIETSSIK